MLETLVALGFVMAILLIGAGLFIRSLRALQELDPGFHTSNLLAFKVDPTLNGYTPERTRAFYDQLTEQGRPKKVALVAVMRKLLTILNAILRDNTPWRPLNA